LSGLAQTNLDRFYTSAPRVRGGRLLTLFKRARLVNRDGKKLSADHRKGLRMIPGRPTYFGARSQVLFPASGGRADGVQERQFWGFSYPVIRNALGKSSWYARRFSIVFATIWHAQLRGSQPLRWTIRAWADGRQRTYGRRRFSPGSASMFIRCQRGRDGQGCPSSVAEPPPNSGAGLTRRPSLPEPAETSPSSTPSLSGYQENHRGMERSSRRSAVSTRRADWSLRKQQFGSAAGGATGEPYDPSEVLWR